MTIPSINVFPWQIHYPCDDFPARHGYFPGSMTEGKGTRSYYGKSYKWIWITLWTASKLSAALRKPQVQSVYVNAMCESPEDKKILRFIGRDL